MCRWEIHTDIYIDLICNSEFIKQARRASFNELSEGFIGHLLFQAFRVDGVF